MTDQPETTPRLGISREAQAELNALGREQEKKYTTATWGWIWRSLAVHVLAAGSFAVALVGAFFVVWLMSAR